MSERYKIMSLSASTHAISGGSIPNAKEFKDLEDAKKYIETDDKVFAFAKQRIIVDFDPQNSGQLKPNGEIVYFKQ